MSSNLMPPGPMPRMVYLAGPIEGITSEEASTWRDRASSLLAAKGVATFNPQAAFHQRVAASRGAFARQVVTINRTAILESDAVLVNLSGPGRGFGTIREVEFSRANGKPVVVWHNPDNPIVSLEAEDLSYAISLDAAIYMVLRSRTRTD